MGAQKITELGTESVRKLLMKYALPGIIAMTAMSLYNMVDSIFIGHGVGALALSGLTVAKPFMDICAAFGTLVGVGASSLVAIKLGEKDYRSANDILANVIILNVILGAIIMVVGLFWLDPILYAFGASEATIVYAREYMEIILLGNILTHIYYGLNSMLRSVGHPRISMYATILAVSLNIILDPIFIFGFDMGVRGAAFATIVSQAVSAVWVLSFLLGKKTKLRIKKENLLPSTKILLPVLALGISPFVMSATEAVINVAFNSSLQKYGGDIAVGAMTICTTVFQMVWVPAQGIGQGAQPIISYNYGARNGSRVKQAFKAFLIICFSYIFVFGMIIELFPQFFIKIFNDNPELMEQATWAIRLYGCALVFFGIQMAVQQTFIALGKAKASLFIACLRKVILLVPLIYILPNFFENKVFAVFLAEPVSDAISITTASVVFFCVFGKEMKKLSK